MERGGSGGGEMEGEGVVEGGRSELGGRDAGREMGGKRD